MAEGWTASDLGIFLVASWENLILNPSSNKKNKWENIAASCIAASPPNCHVFSADSCRNVARYIKSYVMENLEVQKGSTFRKFHRDVAYILNFFPPESTENNQSDIRENMYESIFTDLIERHMSDIINNKPSIWQDLSHEAYKIFDVAIDVELIIKAAKIDVISRVSTEVDPHHKRIVFCKNVKKFIVSIFDYVYPTVVKKKDYLAPLDSSGSPMLEGNNILLKILKRIKKHRSLHESISETEADVELPPPSKKIKLQSLKKTNTSIYLNKAFLMKHSIDPNLFKQKPVIKLKSVLKAPKNIKKNAGPAVTENEKIDNVLLAGHSTKLHVYYPDQARRTDTEPVAGPSSYFPEKETRLSGISPDSKSCKYPNSDTGSSIQKDLFNTNSSKLKPINLGMLKNVFENLLNTEQNSKEPSETIKERNEEKHNALSRSKDNEAISAGQASFAVHKPKVKGGLPINETPLKKGGSILKGIRPEMFVEEIFKNSKLIELFNEDIAAGHSQKITVNKQDQVRRAGPSFYYPETETRLSRIFPDISKSWSEYPNSNTGSSLLRPQKDVFNTVLKNQNKTTREIFRNLVKDLSQTAQNSKLPPETMKDKNEENETDQATRTDSEPVADPSTSIPNTETRLSDIFPDFNSRSKCSNSYAESSLLHPQKDSFNTDFMKQKPVVNIGMLKNALENLIKIGQNSKLSSDPKAEGGPAITKTTLKKGASISKDSGFNNSPSTVHNMNFPLSGTNNEAVPGPSLSASNSEDKLQQTYAEIMDLIGQFPDSTVLEPENCIEAYFASTIDYNSENWLQQYLKDFRIRDIARVQKCYKKHMEELREDYLRYHKHVQLVAKLIKLSKEDYKEDMNEHK